jgi:hypothetical protein
VGPSSRLCIARTRFHPLGDQRPYDAIATNNGTSRAHSRGDRDNDSCCDDSGITGPYRAPPGCGTRYDGRLHPDHPRRVIASLRTPGRDGLCDFTCISWSSVERCIRTLCTLVRATTRAAAAQRRGSELGQTQQRAPSARPEAPRSSFLGFAHWQYHRKIFVVLIQVKARHNEA